MIEGIKRTCHRSLYVGIRLEKDFQEESAMQTYLIMGKFTEKGITNIKKTTERADKFKEVAAKLGIQVQQIYWLIGDYDVVNIVEAPDDQAVEALLVRVGAWGNVRTTTFRAFDKKEMDAIIAKMDDTI
jgi:uncharacterized protein with GYD domain